MRSSFKEPPGKGTAEAGREFLRALATDIAAATRHAWRRTVELSAAIPAVFPPRPATADARSDNRRRRGWRVPGAVKLAALLIVMASITVTAAMLWAVAEVPMERAVAADMQPSIIVESADGQPMARRGPLKLADVEREAFPVHLVQAVLSIEDRSFYSHWGIDFRGGARALYRNIAAQRVVEGGSTITQQLVKVTMLGSERTMTRKLREVFLAVWLESQLDKEEILTRYLNNIYLGAGAYGMPAAVRRYFSKDLSEVTLAEAAMLAALIRAPSQLNPLTNYEAARARAEVVLDAMVASGAVDPEAAEQAKAEPAQINRMETASGADTWFADWAAEQALGLPNSDIGNIRVRTTLEPELQSLAEEVVADMLNGAGAERGVSQAALVAMRTDGAVVALVGGRDYEESQFNRAVQGLRQPGSAFKVFVYYAALRNGLRPSDLIEDAPLELEDDLEEWEPANFDREYYGEVTLGEAFSRSLNAATVRLALEVGLDEVVAAARDLGIEAPLTETPSLALGAYEVSLLEMTGAFAAIRAGEAPIKPWGIAAVGAGDDGPLVTMGPLVAERHSLGEVQEPLLELLHEVVQRGTGQRAALDGFAAGKTGTSQRYRDAWFVGFTEDIIVGIWVGNDDGAPMDEVVGGQLPAETWREFVTRATPLLPDGGPLLSPRPAEEELDEPRVVVGFEIPDDLDGLEQWEEADELRDRLENADLDETEDTEEQRQQERRERLAERVRRQASEEPEDGRQEDEEEEQIVQTEWMQRIQSATADEASETTEPNPQAGLARQGQAQCDVEACSRQYRSFRASDCTYQPYGGGPRRICTRGSPTEDADEPATTGLVPQEASAPGSGQGQCNYSACARSYSSFRDSDCTYQPYGGGPRRICTR